MKREFLIYRFLFCVSMLLGSVVSFSQTPYNVVMNFTQDPTTQMAFNWFTAANSSCGQVMVIGGGITKIVSATCSQYSGATINKATVTGLTPNTTYSFQIGSVNGTFKTAPNNNLPFSFIYVADTQIDYFLMGKPLSEYSVFPMLQMNAQVLCADNQDTRFCLHGGDMVWEGRVWDGQKWELDFDSDIKQWYRFFASQPDLFLKLPFAPVMGNHDKIFNNFKPHFNVNSAPFDTDGSTYTFIYGNTQFFAINSEKDITYINNLKKWMQDSVRAHPNITWRVVYCHTGIYSSYNTDSYLWSNNIAPLFDTLGIDIVFQGHTHIYDVIGPVRNKNYVQASVINVTKADTQYPENISGKLGGVFNVQKGTLYITNGTLGNTGTLVPKSLTSTPPLPSHYLPLMTGRWGQLYNSYSNVSVTSDKIIITTYEIVNGNSQMFDEITIVKRPCLPSVENPVSQTISSNTVWSIPQSISNNIV
ncbi:MAG: metallophosphoesterase family protein, partial [Bacteroidales bacterium]|nr:metallophosphoesterase family protein [Bacteroidales bacterium]